jgi:hypothetical protein
MAEMGNRSFEVHLIQDSNGRLRLDTVGSPTNLETMGIIETFRAVLRLRALDAFRSSVEAAPDMSPKKVGTKKRRRHQ